MSSKHLKIRKKLEGSHFDTVYENLISRYGCSLCNEVFVNTFTTNCRHKFCRRCILKWLRYYRKCPECVTVVTKISPMKRVDAEIERIFLSFPPNIRKYRDNLKKKRFRAELEWKRMRVEQDILSTSSNADRMKAAEGLRQQIKENSRQSVSVGPVSVRKKRPSFHSSRSTVGLGLGLQVGIDDQPPASPKDQFHVSNLKSIPSDTSTSHPKNRHQNRNQNDKTNNSILQNKNGILQEQLQLPQLQHSTALILNPTNQTKTTKSKVEFLKFPPLIDHYEDKVSTQTSLGSGFSVPSSTKRERDPDIQQHQQEKQQRIIEQFQLSLKAQGKDIVVLHDVDGFKKMQNHQNASSRGRNTRNKNNKERHVLRKRESKSTNGDYSVDSLDSSLDSCFSGPAFATLINLTKNHIPKHSNVTEDAPKSKPKPRPETVPSHDHDNKIELPSSPPVTGTTPTTPTTATVISNNKKTKNYKDLPTNSKSRSRSPIRTKVEEDDEKDTVPVTVINIKPTTTAASHQPSHKSYRTVPPKMIHSRPHRGDKNGTNPPPPNHPFDSPDEVEEFLKQCPVEKIWEHDLFISAVNNVDNAKLNKIKDGLDVVHVDGVDGENKSWRNNNAKISRARNTDGTGLENELEQPITTIPHLELQGNKFTRKRKLSDTENKDPNRDRDRDRERNGTSLSPVAFFLDSELERYRGDQDHRKRIFEAMSLASTTARFKSPSGNDGPAPVHINAATGVVTTTGKLLKSIKMSTVKKPGGWNGTGTGTGGRRLSATLNEDDEKTKSENESKHSTINNNTSTFSKSKAVSPKHQSKMSSQAKARGSTAPPDTKLKSKSEKTERSTRFHERLTLVEQQNTIDARNEGNTGAGTGASWKTFPKLSNHQQHPHPHPHPPPPQHQPSRSNDNKENDNPKDQNKEVLKQKHTPNSNSKGSSSSHNKKNSSSPSPRPVPAGIYIIEKMIRKSNGLLATSITPEENSTTARRSSAKHTHINHNPKNTPTKKKIVKTSQQQRGNQLEGERNSLEDLLAKFKQERENKKKSQGQEDAAAEPSPLQETQIIKVSKSSLDYSNSHATIQDDGLNRTFTPNNSNPPNSRNRHQNNTQDPNNKTFTRRQRSSRSQSPTRSAAVSQKMDPSKSKSKPTSALTKKYKAPTTPIITAPITTTTAKLQDLPNKFSKTKTKYSNRLQQQYQRPQQQKRSGQVNQNQVSPEMAIQTERKEKRNIEVSIHDIIENDPPAHLHFENVKRGEFRDDTENPVPKSSSSISKADSRHSSKSQSRSKSKSRSKSRSRSRSYSKHPREKSDSKKGGKNEIAQNNLAEEDVIEDQDQDQNQMRLPCQFHYDSIEVDSTNPGHPLQQTQKVATVTISRGKSPKEANSLLCGTSNQSNVSHVSYVFKNLRTGRDDARDEDRVTAASVPVSPVPVSVPVPLPVPNSKHANSPSSNKKEAHQQQGYFIPGIAISNVEILNTSSMKLVET